jgi:hypothetical protein
MAIEILHLAHGPRGGTKLFIDQRQELLGSPRVALLDVRQNPRDIAHDCDSL